MLLIDGVMTVMQGEVSNSSRLSLSPSDTRLLNGFSKLLLMLQQRLSNAAWSTPEKSIHSFGGFALSPSIRCSDVFGYSLTRP